MRRATYRLFVAGLLACVLAGGFGAWVHAQVSSGLPDVLTYRGYLEGPDGALNGTRELEFALYDTATAGTGTRLWGPSQHDVAFSDGHFAAQLSGLAASSIGNSSTWLEVGVIEPGGAVRTLGRQALFSVPYAFRSGRAASAANADAAASAAAASGALRTELNGLFRGSGGTINGNVRIAQDLVVQRNEWGSVNAAIGYGNSNWSHTTKEASCPPGTFAAGIRVEYGGTCQERCNADGGTIRDIKVICRSL